MAIARSDICTAMNDKFHDVIGLFRIQLLLTVLFIFFKFIRPSVLAGSYPDLFKIILLSLPNFFESIIGLITLTGIALVANDSIHVKWQLKPNVIYVVCMIVSGIYVLAQELDIINLRKNDTMDINDVIFSIIGLLAGYTIIVLRRPRILSKSDTTI